MRWVQRFPGRLEYEIADFERHGLAAFLLDERERRQGRVVLDGSIQHDGQLVQLRVVFPDAYPYFRPEVYAPDLRLSRHQNPFEGNLCLLEAPTRAWNATETAASLISQQVPFLLDLLTEDGEGMVRNEVPQGEPASYYIGREHGTAVFVPEEPLHLPREVRCGHAYFSFSPERVGAAVHLLLRQVNGWSKSGGGKKLAAADERLVHRFEGHKIEGRWVRLDHSPGRDPETYFIAAEAVQAGFGNPLWQRIGADEIAVLGVVFEEEVRQGVWEDAWLFAVRFRTRNPLAAGAYVTKGDRAAAEDYFARVPRLRGVENKTAALLGLGSLGAPLAFELGRAQLGELRILDHDIVEAGTTVRWPVGLPAVGSFKTAVVEATVKSHYPRTTITSFQHRIGVASAEHGNSNDFEMLEQLLDSVDLVIDATAEIAVQYLIADLARESSLRQVYLWATEGSFGGAVARCLPGETGCWYCLQLALDENSIEAPPREPTGTTQPRGCGTLTFTGESFNLLPVVAQAARVVTGTLLDELPAGQDVFIMSFRDGDAAAPAPRWKTYPLHRHPKCPYCAVD